ncbi:lysine--tRNA ligase [Arsenophonus symbiont of Ornithomya chloropus]|uniref:lysine--tRNA ligase n=1 Tax=Arsenophonus symbiont of Ornithomya chloropus TaxID=634121 RepID=UPI0032B18E93
MFHKEDQKAFIDLNNDKFKSRRDKLMELRDDNIAFPNNFRREHLSSDLHIKYNHQDSDIFVNSNLEFSVAGRILTKRIMGKASFITLQDMGGCIQIYVSSNDLTEDIYQKKIKKLDLGDIVGVKGKLFRTKTGELTIRCHKIYLLTKALRSLPNKFHGLTDQEIRYRQRYLDLIVNNRSRKIFIIRSKVLSVLRNFMLSKNFMEVETPMMQVIPGGASARPFITHHNTLNIDMYLRVSPELYLKRLVIGGFERIFEINRNFRNEGISSWHNPEFTMMEFYMAYADYKDLIFLIEELFHTVTQEVLGKTQIKYGDYLLDFGQPFVRMTMKEAISKYCKEINITDLDNFDKVSMIMKLFNIEVKKHWGLGRLQFEIFNKKVENHLIQPTFITEYPTEVSPLSRHSDKNFFIADRFELFVAGHEICNGFSELNDPEEQSKRFIQKIRQRNKEDYQDGIFYDEDYIIALEHGLPPTAGLGIGIDRMIMLLTNSHTIRDVILFPTLRTVK